MMPIIYKSRRPFRIMPKGGQSKKARGGVARSRERCGVVCSGRLGADLRDYLNDVHGLKVPLNVEVRVTVPDPPVSRRINRFIIYAALVADMHKMLASLRIPLNAVRCLVDGPNQSWFLKLLKEFDQQFTGMQICVVASQSAMLTLDSNIKPSFVKIIVPDGDASKGEVIGFNEDGMVEVLMNVLKPIILVSGDCKTTTGECQLYNGICWRLHRGLQTIVIARKNSCSDELKLLQRRFPRILSIMEVVL
jgi:hypothetical protein